MRFIILALALFVSSGWATTSSQPPASNGRAAVLTINGPIGPATRDYINGALAQAQTQHARVIVLKLDTPGGLSKSMHAIIRAILASPIPVVGYVAPQGARAASAGTYILYATAIAAMAPGTHLGAATPVPVMGTEKAHDLTAEQRKIINDAAAYIRGLATQHGRNADWAEKAVRHAASITATQALKKNVVNVLAPNMTALLGAIDGRTVTVNGQSQVLHTQHLRTHTIEPSWRIEWLQALSNPTLVYILFIGGLIGLVLEAIHPGLVFPGVVGAICLMAALFGFEILPISWVGLGLIILGLAFMAGEAVVPSFGSLGIGGIVAFIIGSIMLMDTHSPHFQIKLAVIIAVAIVAAGCLILAAGYAIRAHRRKVVSGRDEMLGATAQVLKAFRDTGQVRVHGEIWRARTTQPVKKGQAVKITHIEGLNLNIEPIDEGDA